MQTYLLLVVIGCLKLHPQIFNFFLECSKDGRWTLFLVITFYVLEDPKDVSTSCSWGHPERVEESKYRCFRWRCWGFCLITQAAIFIGGRYTSAQVISTSCFFYWRSEIRTWGPRTWIKSMRGDSHPGGWGSLQHHRDRQRAKESACQMGAPGKSCDGEL